MASVPPSAPAEASQDSCDVHNLSSPQRQQQQQQHQKWNQKPRQNKRSFQQESKSRKKSKKRERDMKTGTHEEVLALDIQELLASQSSTLGANEDQAVPEETLPEEGSEVEVEVLEISSTGEGLAQQKGFKQIYVVPFSVPGDIVRVKAYRHTREGYTVGDFISVVKPSPLRDDSRINCKYFAKCSGCQFQMLDYAEQLRLKKRIVEKAFKNFSQLPPELIPAIQDTIGSPLQYNYRTKLTPHFDGPKGWFKGNNPPFTSRPNIGFTPKTSRATMDIEECPIGTDILQVGMQRERERMATEFNKYNKGSTILLRESTKRIPKRAVSPASSSPEPPAASKDVITVEKDDYTDYKTCTTDNHGITTEYIGDYVFHNPANSFFQNNNSILPVFTDYIRQHILPVPVSTDQVPTASNPIKYLIDAYSGSGLFTITLSSVFESSTGIDIDPKSIQFARKNAEANKLPESQAKFIAADASELFKSVTYPADETVVVLDPPRKGCDSGFLSQLLRFGPKRVVYVSCNVHTQARDVGMLVRGEAGDEASAGNGPNAGSNEKKVRYEIETLRGFDFFPQTGHVEGVAVLNRVIDEPKVTETPTVV